MTEITRRIVFHAGHMLKDDTSKCFHPHGHEYVFDVTITGPVQVEGGEAGMVMNFGSLKELMVREVSDKFDHKFIIQDKDPRCLDFLKAVKGIGVVVVPFPPTAEHLANYFAGLLYIHLGNGIKLTKVRLQETLNCWADVTPK